MADDHRHWSKALAPYREPSLARSLVELAVTAVPFVTLGCLMWLSLRHIGYRLGLRLAIPLGGRLVFAGSPRTHRDPAAAATLARAPR